MLAVFERGSRRRPKLGFGLLKCLWKEIFRGKKPPYLQQILVNSLKVVCQKSCTVSAVWVQRCCVLFGKESSNQICRGLTEV